MCLNKKFTKEEWNLNESLRISNEIERISNLNLYRFPILQIGTNFEGICTNLKRVVYEG